MSQRTLYSGVIPGTRKKTAIWHGYKKIYIWGSLVLTLSTAAWRNKHSVNSLHPLLFNTDDHSSEVPARSRHSSYK